MTRCRRCGQDFPRTSASEERCPQCAREVAERERQDARRGTVRARYTAIRDLTGVR